MSRPVLSLIQFSWVFLFTEIPLIDRDQTLMQWMVHSYCSDLFKAVPADPGTAGRDAVRMRNE